VNNTSPPGTFDHHPALIRALIKLGLICFIVGGALMIRDMWTEDRGSSLPTATKTADTRNL
jgi:hypothetical protein